MDLSKFDAIIFHFDGNNNDPDDIAGLPIAATLARAAGIEDKTSFFYSNNLSEPTNNYMATKMRESADFAEKLGIDTHSYQDGIQQTTNELVEILNSGKKVLAIEGGPMEAIYRALAQTSPDNRSNITLLSHSEWNEDRSVGSRPGGGKPRTWQDIRNDFSEVEQIEIEDQNQGAFNDQGFFNVKWNWLDSTDNPVLQEARENMRNANKKVNDPSDAGMLFYAITGNEGGGADDVKEFFDKYPPTFVSLDSPQPVPPVPEPPASSDNDVFLAQNGQLIIEAESADPVGAWKQASVDGEPSLLWDPVQSSYNKVPVGQTLTYHFKTDEAGPYNIALRSGRAKSTMNNKDRYENGTGGKERTDTGNDAYVSIINDETGEVVQTPTKLFTRLGNSDRTLRWGTVFDANHKKSSAQVELEEDTQYRLEITGRSDGYVLDRITLSNDGILRNASTPQSPIQASTLPDPTPEPTPPPAPDPTPDPVPPIPPAEPLLTLSLADAETDQVVAGFETITSQSILNLSELELSQYTLIAQVNPDHPDSNSIKSIKFESDFANQTENVAPYALFGDTNGDFAGEILEPGNYSIKATAYTQKYGQGKAIDSLDLEYSVVESVEDTDLLKLALVNAETDTVVAGFEDLAAIPEVSLSGLDFSHYNLVALVNSEHSDADSIKSVRFEASSENSQGIVQQSQRTENVAPYAVFGDINGDFFEQALTEGDITIKAVAYTEKGGDGDVLDTLSVDYSVVDTSAAQAAVVPEIHSLETFSDHQSIALDYAAPDGLESQLAGQSDSGASGQDLLGNDGTAALGLDLVIDPSVA